MNFLTFQPEDMLNSDLNSNESQPQPVYAYKRYAYNKESTLGVSIILVVFVEMAPSTHTMLLQAFPTWHAPQ